MRLGWSVAPTQSVNLKTCNLTLCALNFVHVAAQACKRVCGSPVAACAQLNLQLASATYVLFFRGMFFTMQFIVRSVYDEMLVLYNQCDPANLEETLIRSLPLLERHWQEFIDSVAEKHPKNKTKQAALDVTEKAVAEVCVCLF